MIRVAFFSTDSLHCIPRSSLLENITSPLNHVAPLFLCHNLMKRDVTDGTAPEVNATAKNYLQRNWYGITQTFSPFGRYPVATRKLSSTPLSMTPDISMARPSLIMAPRTR